MYYNSSDGKLVAEIPNSMPPFAFSPRGNVIAVDSSQGIVLWDLDAAKALRVLEHSEGTFNAPQVRDMNDFGVLSGWTFNCRRPEYAAGRHHFRSRGVGLRDRRESGYHARSAQRD